MKKITIGVLFAITSIMADIQIHTGWNLIGYSRSTTANEFQKNCIDYIFTFDNESKSWSSVNYNEEFEDLNISAYSGIWVYATCETTLNEFLPISSPPSIPTLTTTSNYSYGYSHTSRWGR